MTTGLPGAKGGLVLLGRTYCHLCEVMLKALRSAFPDCPVIELDVDADPMLEERFGDLVPVLLLDGVEVCHYHFDLEALTARLQARAAEIPVNTPPEC